MKNNLIWQKWGGNKIKTLFNSIFCNRLQGGRFQVTMLLSWLVCIVVVLRGIKMAWEEKSIFKQQKKNILHFLIHLPLISTKEIFCTAGREVGCLCFGFLFKMGDSDNLSSGEAPEKPIKNSDIFFILFTEEGRNHYYYSGKKRLHDTHK